MSQEDKENTEVDVMLREAAMLILDPKYGKSRSEKVREAIRRLPKYPRLYRALAPLNRFVVMAQEGDPIRVMNILDVLDKQREKKVSALQERLATNTATTLERRKDNRRENAANYRKRLKNVIIVAEVERGRRMTKEERKALIERKREEWKIALEQKLRESVGKTRQEVSAEFVDQLDKLWQRRADEALAKVEGK